MAKIMNETQLLSAVKGKRFESAAKDLMNYGRIIREANTGRAPEMSHETYQYRSLQISRHGHTFSLELEDGKVKSLTKH